MTKLLFLVRCADDAATLLPVLRGLLLEDPNLRQRLAAAGATALQVNLADEAVRPAMRISSGEDPVAAAVSVWVAGDPAAAADVVVSAVAEAAGDRGAAAVGWQVQERRPLEPPVSPDGTRVDALANVAVLRRPADLDEAEWRHRWLVDHTPVAIKTQATFGYVQNVVEAPVTAGAPAVSAVVEELFPMAAATDLHAFYGSGGDDAELASRMEQMLASVSRFGADRDLDLVPTSRYCWTLDPAGG
ncbi:hypothetical protein [Nocardioides sp. SYSU DS0663]|uniref:hypothetical protein n=1 Tax=Nocardioides sp. SYSU DS0663 TaxID=3416445 RepID=UPI003F4B6EE5